MSLPADDSAARAWREKEEVARMRSVAPNTMFTKLVVRDLDRCADFYREVCDLREMLRLESVMNHRPMREVMFEYQDGSTAPLVIMEYLDGTEPTHGQSVTVIFTDDLDAFVERVERCGGRMDERREDSKNDCRIAFWFDPEGNLMETVQMGRRESADTASQ